MEVFEQLGMTGNKFKCLNSCRTYLQGMTVSDIIMEDVQSFMEKAWKGILALITHSITSGINSTNLGNNHGLSGGKCYNKHQCIKDKES